MNLASLLASGVWAGLLSAACVVLFSAPIQILPAAAGAGFLARVLRDALTQAGASQALATFAAAAAVVIVMSALIRIRRPGLSPVVVLSGLVPLGAAKSFFEAIVGLVRAPVLTGDALTMAQAAIIANITTVFTMTLALALGVAIGALIIATSESLFASDNARSEL